MVRISTAKTFGTKGNRFVCCHARHGQYFTEGLAIMEPGTGVAQFGTGQLGLLQFVIEAALFAGNGSGCSR